MTSKAAPSRRTNIRPVGTWVDPTTKHDMRTRWKWAGHRSEAAYLRGLIHEDLQKNPPPDTSVGTEGQEEEVGSQNIEEQGT